MAQAPGPNSGPNLFSDQFAYAVVMPVPPVRPKIAPRGPFDPSSCVSYVKYKRPDLEGIWVNPKVYSRTHKLLEYPMEGMVGISREGPVWHAWYIEKVSSGSMLISEANFLGDYVSTRSLPVDSQLIVGYQ